MLESITTLLPEGFKFLRPEWFWALLPMALLFWLLLRRRSRRAAWSKVCDAHLLPHLLTGAETRRVVWPLFLLLPAWVAVVIALAGPVWQQLPQPVFQSEAARVIVLDLSRSMDATDVAPSRLARAKFKLLDLLKRSDVGQTALVVFAGGVFVVSPLTQDANTIAAMVPALETAIMPVQGSRADQALLRADALFDQGKAPKGDIILITDGVNSAAINAAREIADRGRRVSVLAVGTVEGAPIPVRVGGFLKDRNGGIVIPRLDLASLSELAAAGGGLFTPMKADDSDVALLVQENNSADWNSESQQRSELKTESWREEGPWLLLGVLPLALLAFRRGGLVCLVALSLYIAQPDAAMAGWDELWLNPNQQGERLLEAGKPQAAARHFQDPAWQANAYYRAGDYEKAAQLLEQIDTADGHYNRANALAKQGKLDEALAAYEKALALSAGQEATRRDAEFNRDLVKQLLEQQSQQSEGGEGDESQESDSRDQASQEQQDGESQQNQPGQSGDDSDSQPQPSQQQQGEPSEQGDESQSQQQGGEQGDEASQAVETEQQQAAEEEGDQSGDEQGSMIDAEGEDGSQPSEDQQAVEQWLRRVPDDPGGLLRRKFLYQYQRQQSQGNGQQADEAW